MADQLILGVGLALGIGEQLDRSNSKEGVDEDDFGVGR
jgi:hypothetical protein